MMKWSMVRPGRWAGTDGTNTAEVHKMREGVLHGSEWMWVVRVNGEHITNEWPLAAAKKIVDRYLADPDAPLYPNF